MRQKYNSVIFFTGIEQLMSKFTAKRCPFLANKPKVFFIQACRGPAEDEFFTQSKDHKDYVAGLTCDSTLARCISSCLQESDFLLGFATVPGYVAYKQTNYGSFYMQVSRTTVYQLNVKHSGLLLFSLSYVLLVAISIIYTCQLLEKCILLDDH